MLTRHLGSVSVLLFGSCHLILFVSTTNFIQIVRRQCCLLRWVFIFLATTLMILPSRWWWWWWQLWSGHLNTWTAVNWSAPPLPTLLQGLSPWSTSECKNLSRKSWEVKNLSTWNNLRKFRPHLRKCLPHLRKSSMSLLRVVLVLFSYFDFLRFFEYFICWQAKFLRKLVTSLQNNCAFSLSVCWSRSRWCLVSPLDRCELGPRPCYIAPQYHSPLYHPSLYHSLDRGYLQRGRGQP